MATPTQIQELRLAIKEPNDAEPYTDAFLGSLIDLYGVPATAGKIWRSKAGSVSSLVDISEGGSSRKMSQLFENYSKLALSYETEATDPLDSGATRPSLVHKIGRI